MKKIAIIALSVLLALCFVSCNKPAETAADNTPATTQASTPATTPAKTETKTETPVAPATYTYNYALTTFPTNWNIHTYETNIDAEIADYITAGFYTFDYNDTKDGYKVVPFMATSEPRDVTEEYVGQYGLTEDSYAQAYVITLRKDIKWQDGTPITAVDFVESAKRLENPVAQNYRADNLYSGNMVIHNAQNYLYGGKTVKLENATNAYYTMADLTKGADGQYVSPNGEKVFLAVDYTLAEWLGGNTLKTYVDNYGSAYFALDTWDQLVALMNDEGLVPLTDENYALYAPVTTGNPAWGETEADLPAYFVYESSFPVLDWSEVGMKALSDYELLIVLDKPLSGFYLLYSLTDSWLVKCDAYDACESIIDGVYTNTYGTSAETTWSYGPYMLTAFQADKQYTLVKNPYFFELNDAAKYDTPIYQTTSIIVDFVPEAATRLELFIQGKLDSYGLTKDDMEKYSLSDFCYYTPGDSTYFMVFNPDYDALVSMQAAAGANVNKTILCIEEFRQAMSFAMNRADFCLATSPTNGAAFALYSSLIISNPEEGVAYRTTDQAKNVMVNFWGLSNDIGQGKLYETVDDAIESITGYNLSKAQQLFNTAYDKALALGYLKETDKIEIKIGTPNNTSAFYNNGYEYIVNNYTEAVKGTKLEGKLVFTRDDTLGNGFSDAIKNNQVDMLFGVGWTGSTLDPYGLMEAYTDANYVYNPCWDTTKETLTINVHGEDLTATVRDWNYIMTGDSKTVTRADGTTFQYSCGEADNDPETRLDILAALEMAVLMTYEEIPLMDASTAGLKGMQIKYYTEDYVFGMGRGGIKYFTFNYTDADWDAYVASQNSVLKYN